MAHEDNNMDPQEFPFKPISARQFLDLFPLSMSEEEKAECEKAKKESALVRLIIKADHEAATH